MKDKISVLILLLLGLGLAGGIWMSQNVADTRKGATGGSCSGGCYSSGSNCGLACGKPCRVLSASEAAAARAEGINCWEGAKRCCPVGDESLRGGGEPTVRPTVKPTSGQGEEVPGGAVSVKKGVAGGVIPAHLGSWGESWFYNWGYKPGYKNEADNWRSDVWQKFVPMFSPWQQMNLEKIRSNTDSQMKEVCEKGKYCGKGNYYLIGNEPDYHTNGGQERVGATMDEAAKNAVVRHGEMIKKIVARDSSARLIMVGFTRRSDDFVNTYIRYWKSYWGKDSVLADLPGLIRGWHFHIYEGYNVCPGDDSYFRGAVSYIDSKMREIYGRVVPNQEVWVTEMGSLSGVPAEGSSERGSFYRRMQCLVDTYEKSNLIKRYAWFYYGCSSSSHTFCKEAKTNYNLANSEGGVVLKKTDLWTRYAGGGSEWTGNCYSSEKNCSSNCAKQGGACQMVNTGQATEAKSEGYNCWNGAFRCRL